MSLGLAMRWIQSTSDFPNAGTLQCFPFCLIQVNIHNAVRSNMPSHLLMLTPAFFHLCHYVFRLFTTRDPYAGAAPAHLITTLLCWTSKACAGLFFATPSFPGPDPFETLLKCFPRPYQELIPQETSQCWLHWNIFYKWCEWEIKQHFFAINQFATEY